MSGLVSSFVSSRSLDGRGVGQGHDRARQDRLGDRGLLFDHAGVVLLREAMLQKASCAPSYARQRVSTSTPPKSDGPAGVIRFAGDRSPRSFSGRKGDPGRLGARVIARSDRGKGIFGVSGRLAQLRAENDRSRRSREGGADLYASRRSTIVAIPCPTPMHIVASPYRPPVRRSSWASIVIRRPPLMPERVTERDRPAVDVDLGRIEARARRCTRATARRTPR